MTRAGELNFQITIQQPSISQTYGEPNITWSTFALVMAKIEPLSGREYFASKQIIDEQVFRFTIRWINNITTKMRILYDSNYYDIQDIINLKMRNKEIQLMCRLAA